MYLKSIRIKRVKGLDDTGLISLSPITLLVGKNSSGKSTFLRTFPLIKQSIRKSTDGPLLWAGDADDYVDFGSFLETIKDGQTQNSIEFQFNFDLKLKRNHYYSSMLNNKLKRDEDCEVIYGISINQIGNKEYVSQLSVHFCQTDFIFKMKPNPNDISIIVDNIIVPPVKKMPKNLLSWNRESKSIFGFQLPPINAFLELISNFITPNDSSISGGLTLENFGIEEVFLPFSIKEISMQIIGECLCKKVSLENVFKNEDEGKSHKNPDSEITKYISQIVEQINNLDDEKKEQIVSILKLIYFYGCFSIMDTYLDNYFRQVHYIAPLRATAERYYRLRNVSIEEVDYQGKNLSIFLDGLRRNDQLESFNKWTDELLGFHVQTKNDVGHLSIHVALKGKETSINLSDTGFGFSQILPIITQLWKISTKKSQNINQKDKSFNIPFVLAIEQPELHLHPGLQASLVEAFINGIKLAKKNNYNLQLILETHSETIVNYFGLAIAENKIDKEDISIVLFEKDNDNSTKVYTSTYDDEGYLCNWPIGFFTPKR